MENKKYYGKLSESINVTVPEVILGDISGDGVVTLEDAQLTLKAALKMIAVKDTQILAADVDSSSGITLEDAQMILKAALKIKPLRK